MNRWLAVAGVVLAGVAVVPAAAAQVQEEVWQSLKGRQVFVEQNDGTSVRGTLGSVDGKRIGVVRKDGVVAVLDKERVRIVRATDVAPGARVTAPAPWRPSAPPPIVGTAPMWRPMPPPPFMHPPYPPMMPPCAMYAHGMAVYGCAPQAGQAMSRVISTIELTPPGRLLQALLRMPDAARLHPYEQAFLFERYKDDGAGPGVAVALNMLLFPGLGSLVQRDYLGSFLTAGAWVGGIAMLAKATSCRSSCSSAGVAAGLMLGGYIFGIIRPWFYESPRARALKSFFSRRMRIAGNTVELSPSFQVAQGANVGEDARTAPPLPGASSRTDFATATQVTGGIEARF